MSRARKRSPRALTSTLTSRDHFVSEASAGSDSSARGDGQPDLHDPAGGLTPSPSAASSRSSNPFASLEAEQTLVSPASRKMLKLARGSDAETKTYEVPAELLALARPSAKERARRRASTPVPRSPSVESVAPTGAESRASASLHGRSRERRAQALAHVIAAFVASWWRAVSIRRRRRLGVSAARLSQVVRRWTHRASAFASGVRERLPAWRSSLRVGFRRSGRWQPKPRARL
jgi:hypothetical protein